MRSQLIEDFLRSNNLSNAQRIALPQDASFRRYERIKHQGKTYILMDAPPEKESTKEFVLIDKLLRAIPLSAPEIYAHNHEHGLMLLEDFGDQSFNKFLATATPEVSAYYYRIAADLIKLLQQHHIHEELPAYTWELYKCDLDQFTEHYVPVVSGSELSTQAKDDFYGIWKELLEQHLQLDNVLVLRDYHADNVHILPDRQGVASLGVIDFQDAIFGSPAYDLVSFLEDARRKVKEAETNAALSAYLRDESGDYQAQFRAEYVILGAQRNLKIMGFLTRKAYLEDRKHYAAFIPTTLGYIRGNFQSPLLQPLANWCKQAGLADDLRLEYVE